MGPPTHVAVACQLPPRRLSLRRGLCVDIRGWEPDPPHRHVDAAADCEQPELPSPAQRDKAAAADGALQIDADPCPICLDTVTNGFRTPCGHIFCSACLAHALFRNDSCPVCRSRGVHTCATPKDDCPLCVAGHKPGVVVPNVYVREERARRRLADSLTRLQRCLSIGAFVLLVYMGARGMFTMDLHFAVAGLACALLMLANMVGHIVGAYARLSLLITRRRSPQAQPAVEEAV